MVYSPFLTFVFISARRLRDWAALAKAALRSSEVKRGGAPMGQI